MKYTRIFISKQGAAYLSVLIAVLMTSILGVALLTFSLVNMNSAALLLTSNDTFYKTESNIATVQLEIEKQVRAAQDIAKKAAEEQRNTFINEATTIDPETGFSVFNEDLFKKAYKKYFNDIFNQYLFKDNENNGKKIILALKDTVSGIVSIIMPEYANLLEKPDQDLFVTVEAEKQGAGVTKFITTKFKILREPSISLRKVVSKRRNPIWMRAVTAEGDLIATGGKVTIDCGNDNKNVRAVYAWGTNKFRDVGSNEAGMSYGGIIAGVNQNLINSLNLGKFGLSSESGDIDITGGTFTDSYIHTFYNNSSVSIDVSSEFTESSQDFGMNPVIPRVYAESFQTEDFSNNNIITINGDAVARDDLEINYSNSKIDISGSFLGFSSGPESDFANDKFANRSSSIAYNDESESSTIDIGKYVVVSGVAYNSNVLYSLDPYKYTPYKTGESLGLGENHKIYRYYFDGENVADTFDNNFKVNIDGEQYDYPLFSGKSHAEDAPNDVGFERIERFKKYLINYCDTSNTTLDYEPNLGNDIIKIGDNNDGKVEGYSLGVLPANGKLYFPLNLEPGDINSNAYRSGLLRGFNTIYDSLKMNTLKSTWKDKYNKETWIANKKTDRKTSSEFSGLVDLSVNFNANTESNNTVLIANSGDIEIDISRLNGKSGLIMAKGNVIIKGSSAGEFSGAIVAGGCIIFKGSGEKRVTFDEKAVLAAINLNDNVKAALSKGGISEVEPDSIEIELKAQKNALVVDYREVK